MSIKSNYITVLMMALLAIVNTSCESPYDNVTGGEVYSGEPYVMLSSEESSIYLEVNDKNNSDQPGVFVDSLILSHKLDSDLEVTLETVAKSTRGEIDVNFQYQDKVVIKAGSHFGQFEVKALDIPADSVNDYRLVVIIKSTNNSSVIAGLNGVKLENEDRQKRNKAYSFRK